MPSIDRNTQHPPKLLVTGASGNLGYWICRMAMASWAVTGIHLQRAVLMDGIQTVQADLTAASVLSDLVASIKPHAVIHAAAASQPVLCERHPEKTRIINVDVPGRLAALCADLQIPFIFTSTDLVFDGRNAPYAEQDPVTPICVYGHQKADAEETVLKVNGNALVCRMPLMIGVSPVAAGGFSMQMLQSIRCGDPLRLLTDELRTPVSYVDAAQGLLALLGNTNGCLHMGGRSRVSRYDMGLLMAKQMGIAPTMFQPVTLETLNITVPRSPDCSLVSDKAYALGYDPSPLPSAVEWAVRQFEEISKG